MWELKDKFWHYFSTSVPTLQQSWWLQEMFRGGEKFSLHNEVNVNGYITKGDIVVFTTDDRIHVGELFMNVGVDDYMYAVVSSWEFRLEADPDPDVWTLTVRDSPNKVPIESLLTSATYRMSGDRATCSVLKPKFVFECI